MIQYTITVKLGIDSEQEMRTEIVKAVFAEALRGVNINAYTGAAKHPQVIDVQVKKG